LTRSAGGGCSHDDHSTTLAKAGPAKAEAATPGGRKETALAVLLRSVNLRCERAPPRRDDFSEN
jgi:hypothetical protein